MNSHSSDYNSNCEWSWLSEWPAPAKLNLFLHVVGRRPDDGYHQLQTVFRFVNRGDTLRFEPAADADDDSVRLVGRGQVGDGGTGDSTESDLCVRAAKLLRAETGYSGGVTIYNDKRLPIGGGLGGGSSDAATTLLALNHLWGTGLSRQRLQSLGLSLGADVPAFIFGKNSFANGIGEILEAVELPPAWYLVLEPPVIVPTWQVFQSPALRRDTPLMEVNDWCPGVGVNDLEPVAVGEFSEIGRHLDWLDRQLCLGYYQDVVTGGDTSVSQNDRVRLNRRARMTGSGACVFAEFDDERSARDVLQRLPREMKGWVAEGHTSHPLASL